MKDEQIVMQRTEQTTKEMVAVENFAHTLLNAPEVKSALADRQIPKPVVFMLIHKVLRVRARQLKVC